MNDTSINQLPLGATSSEKRPNMVAGPVDADLDKVVDPRVPVKYRGTEADKKDMLVHGKQQELRRNFKYMPPDVTPLTGDIHALTEIFRFLTMTGFSSVGHVDLCGD